MPRKKYANKSRGMRFFHENTGYIVMSICAVIIAVIWFSYQSEQMFFENWTCLSITKLALNFNAHEMLSEIEHERFHEILDVCFNDEQFFRFEH